MQSFSREIPGTAVACPLMGGVCLWKVSAYRRYPFMGGVLMGGVHL